MHAFSRRHTISCKSPCSGYYATSTSQIQNAETCIAVRMRDKCCIVTGQAAVKRARGGNFTGLEVAHIFPLMGVGVVSSPTAARNPFISRLTCRTNGWRPYQHLLRHKYPLVRLQTFLTTLSFFAQIYTVYLMTTNGAYGYVHFTLCFAF